MSQSMGFIYSTAVSVIIVLQGPIWKIIETAASGRSPDSFPLPDLQVLEEDKWISRVWTYQELVNGAEAWFTTTNPSPNRPAVQVQRFLNCVGSSLNRWKKENKKGEMGVLETFPNISVLEEALGDMILSPYLERTALGVLSNIAGRDYDANFPQNRLLACLGALTKEVSWGPPSTSIDELAEKLMKICEARNDYSFIYTSDERSDAMGQRWRPRPVQSVRDKPVHLIPIINWHSSIPSFETIGATQNGHFDSSGFWLEGMVRLQLATSVDEKVVQQLERYLYGFEDPENPHHIHIGIFERERDECLDWREALQKFLVKIGFTGCHQPLVCEKGLFYSQKDIRDREDVELFAAYNIMWKFGNPGLARWKEDGIVRYCAGVYAGLLKQKEAESVLMI